MYDLIEEFINTNNRLILEPTTEYNTERLNVELEKLLKKRVGYENLVTAKKEVEDSLFGYGILQEYIENPEISDIDAIRYDYIVIRKMGISHKIEKTFTSEEEFERFAKLIIMRNGGIINDFDSHARVSDKKNSLRINVSIKPRNLSGTSLTIRKQNNNLRTLDDLEKAGLLNNNTKTIIQKLIDEKRNILICGKGASGKTTLLRVLIETSHQDERMLICESDPELFPKKKNCIVQTTKNSKSDLGQLIEEGLTMTLDTYCIGEITGNEAWQLIKASYTDHRSLATVHALSAFDALNRLIMLCENATNISEEMLRKMIARSLDIVIYMSNFRIQEIIRVENVSESGNFIGEVLYDSGNNLIN